MDRQLTVSPAQSRANAEHWHVGWNVPGDLPELAPGTCMTFEDAQQALAEELAAHADSEETWSDDHDCDDVPCPAYGDSCHWQRASQLRPLRDEVLGAVPGNWSSRSGGLAYWIEASSDRSCRSEIPGGEV